MQHVVTKSAHISIVGMPNAGKSTLLNQVLGQKISIVTHKVQTTRSAIKGILTENNTQLVFIDTPGIFTPKKNLEKSMVRCAWSSISGSDFVCVIISLESLKYFNEEFKKLLEHLAKINNKKIILINKIDKLCIDQKSTNIQEENIHAFFKDKKEAEVLDNLAYINSLFPDSRTFYISALKNHNIKIFLKYLEENAEESPYFYNEDEVTDA
ncbi:MAG: GTPase Era, partial [Rickettsiaceae bacterium]|nr:GTPase Era [Rickettsiaceae bacterium]